MKAKNKREYYDEVIQTVDKDGGEIQTIERKVVKKVQRDRFIAMYLKDIEGIVSLTSKSEFQVLISLCKMVEFNTNEIVLVKDRKETIAKNTGLGYSSVHNTISRLSKKNILVRKAKTVYILNPKYFFKGEEVQRAKVLQLVIQYVIED